MSREYAIVKPQFWTGRTGRAIKALGPEHQVVATYMMTSPHSNMIGLYYLPVTYIAADAGGTPDTIRPVIEALIRVGFCDYDFESGHVWVIRMAHHQLGATLKPGDKRRKAVARAATAVSSAPQYRAFVAAYGAGFGITAEPATGIDHEATKGHHAAESRPESPMPARRVDQDQDKEKDQDQDKEKEASPALAPGSAPEPRLEKLPHGLAERIRVGYCERFARALPKVRPPREACGLTARVWSELAHDVGDDETAVRLLDAAFADEWIASTGFLPNAIKSQRTRLLAHGPGKPRARRERPPTEAPTYTEDLGEFGEVSRG